VLRSVPAPQMMRVSAFVLLQCAVPSQAQPSQAQYIFSDYGDISCSGAYRKITTYEACMAAARAMGKVPKEGKSYSFEAHPSGCNYDNSNQWWFNNHPTGSAHVHQRLVCRLQLIDVPWKPQSRCDKFRTSTKKWIENKGLLCGTAGNDDDFPEQTPSCSMSECLNKCQKELAGGCCQFMAGEDKDGNPFKSIHEKDHLNTCWFIKESGGDLRGTHNKYSFAMAVIAPPRRLALRGSMWV
jgi:hypothetical protein